MTTHSEYRKGSRGPRVLAYCAGVLVIVCIGIILYLSFNTNGNVEASDRTDKIAACGRQIRADVDQKSSDLLVAISQNVAASSRLAALNAEYLRAAEQEDREAQLDVLARSQDALDAVNDTATDMTTAATEFTGSVQEYARKADLSFNNPDKFLALCETGN